MPFDRSPATNLRPGEVWRDPKVPGLHLRAFPTKAVYYLYYRLPGGKERRPKLGDARVLTLTQAREEARQALARLALGADPHPEALRAPAATGEAPAPPSVADLWTRYDAEWATPRKKPRSRSNDETLWRLHILPALGDRQVASIRKADVAALHVAMRRHPHNANRALGLLRKMLNHAVDPLEWIEKNPARGVPLYPERPRKRVPTIDEVRRLLAAIEVMRPSEPFFCGLVELLVFTGCRLREIMHARRDWIRDGALWLPDSKGGERAIVLSSYALAAIDRIPVVHGNPFLIAGDRPGKPMENIKGRWSRLLALAGVENLRRHDLRRLFASTGLSSGIGLDAIGQLLGHTQTQTTRGYSWLVTPAKRAAAEEIGRAIVSPSRSR